MCATFILFNCRAGNIVCCIHALFLIFVLNMNHFKKLFLWYVNLKYRGGTPSYSPKESSPCLPEKEFLESELLVEKGDAFSSDFFSKQKTWLCGPSFCLVYVIVIISHAWVLTLWKRHQIEVFKQSIGANIQGKKNV